MDIEFKLLIAGIIFLILSFIMKRMNRENLPVTQSKIFRTVFEWVETLWSAVLLAAVIMFFVIQAFKIPSGSMIKTLLIGDHLFVNKFIYGIHIPFSDGKKIFALAKVKRADIIVFKCPHQALTAEEKQKGIKKDFIKRAIAIAGDTVEIINKKVYVNGKEIVEPYVNFEEKEYIQPRVRLFSSMDDYQKSWEMGRFVSLPVKDNFGPVKVPENHFFVMGDNRDRSFDSRFWGPLDKKYLKGKALIVYWPLTRIKLIK